MSDELENRLWQKKPVVIEAMQFDGSDNGADEVHEWMGQTSHLQCGAVMLEDGQWEVIITTLEGEMHASPGDWIIKGVQGEFYPCKPDIFEATYQKPDAVSLRARPQEPGDLISRAIEFIESDHDLDTRSEVLAKLREILSAPSGPLSDPEPTKSLKTMQDEVVAFEHMKGWQPNDNRFLESLALLHSEVSEALEAYRDKDWGSIREEDGKPEGVTSELADVFIRLLSTWAQFLTPLGHDLEEQYELKMAYNRTRAYRHGGRTI